jgi:hypothetical protein
VAPYWLSWKDAGGSKVSPQPLWDDIRDVMVAGDGVDSMIMMMMIMMAA